MNIKKEYMVGDIIWVRCPKEQCVECDFTFGYIGPAKIYENMMNSLCVKIPSTLNLLRLEATSQFWIHSLTEKNIKKID